MKLLHRVTTLIRADVVALLAAAENPAAALNQFKADVHNHVLQLRTAIAQTMADLAMFERTPVDAGTSSADAGDRAARLRAKSEDAESLRALLGPLEAKSGEAEAVYANRIRTHADWAPETQPNPEALSGGSAEFPRNGHLGHVLDAIHGYMDRVEAAAVASPPAPDTLGSPPQPAQHRI